MAKKGAYFGSRISDNLIKTPEGYLVCKNVPIARIGRQDYLGCEFGAQDSSKTYAVNRPEAEVFDKAAIASFEGKPVCDNHPPEDVTPSNYSRYMKGICRDVHRGEGEYSNCLMADLVIYDEELIREIEGGKREISCGYDCLWNPTSDSSYDQQEIRGNHIAVVDKGRAGKKVAIRDNAKEERGKTMKNKSTIWGRMLAVFAKDADTTPEDLMEAAKMHKDEEEEKAVPPPAPKEPEEEEKKPAMDEELDARLKKIEDALASLAEAKAAQKEDKPDALDELEEKLESGDPMEEETEEEETDVEDEDLVQDPAEVNEKEGCSAEARDAALQIVKRMKPLVAGIKDEGERRRVSDSLAILIRGNMRTSNDSQYQELMEIAKHKTNDKAVSDEDYGKAIRDKWNPHYKKD